MTKNIFSFNKMINSVLIIVLLGGYSLITATVANDPMRNLSRGQYVKNMFLGWNLGNTFDGSGTETGWGNPVTTQAMIDTVHAKGIKTLRIPVTWSSHFGAAPTYTITPAFIQRLAEVVNYALNDSMYVFINTHHDGWYNLGATGTTATTIATEVATLWSQIATYFKSYSDYLSFEIFNEPNAGAANQYGGGDSTSRTNLANYQTAAVNAIRATGGNNATRMIILQGISASPIQASLATIPMVDNNCIVSVHTYDPTGFSLSGSPTTWGSTSDSQEVVRNLNNLQTWLATKGQVIVLGEWGNTAADQLASREKHAYYYAQQVVSHGGVPIWWDNNSFSGADGFGLLTRKAVPPTWGVPTVVQAMADGAKSGVFPANLLTEVEPPIQNKISFNSGLMVKAGIVNYTLPKTSSVSLCIYNVQGKIVSTLVKTNQSAGNYEVKLPTKGITSGNYVLELKAGNNLVTKRINIL
ncbi:MAG: cellulase family glycosylhydrolase [Chitinivibrionales bacterium]